MPNSFEEMLKKAGMEGSIRDMPGVACRKKMLVIFIVDNSGSMSGEKMDKVNAAFRKMVPNMRELQQKVNDAFELQIAVLVFDSNASWKVTPTPILKYEHEEIDSYGGGTSYGKALRELKSKLNENEYMKHNGKVAKPYIMLMTDGKPTDKGYEDVITELERNIWYKNAQRYAVLIGKKAVHDADARAAVKAFVSNETEGIITAEEAAEIVQAVSAQTMIALKEMTMRSGGGGLEKRKSDQRQVIDKKTEKKTNPYGEEWIFPDAEPDPSAVYGDNYVF